MIPLTFRKPLLGLGVLALSVTVVSGQALISAKAGLVHYTEGDVKIGTQSAAPNNGTFQSLANDKELATGEGRAEMLLGPGQFLRLNENSAVRMVSNKLDATKVAVIRGSVLVEILEIAKGIPVVLTFGENTIELRKTGLYRIDTAESRLRVYDGEAVVQGSGQSLTAKKGMEVTMTAVLAHASFETATGDEFTRWAQRRSGYIATANVSSARTAYMDGYTPNQWVYNPWYSMFTFVPNQRFLMSPFGFPYFSPDFAFNDMFWNYIGGYGYGFFGMGLGYGYGYFPYYGGYLGYPGYGYGYGYGTGPSYGGGGGGGRGNTPITGRTAGSGARGSGNSIGSGVGNGGRYGMPVMTHGGGGNGGVNHPGGATGTGYSGGRGSIAAGGGSYSGGGMGHAPSNGGGMSHGSSAGSSVSSGGGGGMSHASSGGGMSSGVSSGAVSSGGGGGARVK